MRETDLYPPIKAFLEAQGYTVKGEVEGCDVVAVRGEEPPVIVEMKAVFSLALVFQGIARQDVADDVYLAVPPFPGRTGRRNDALALCRRLGLGLLTVRIEPSPFVEALLDPAEYRPRRRRRGLGRLLREFQRRVGDPNQGGSGRRKLMTAYRQDALRCAAYLGGQRTDESRRRRRRGRCRQGPSHDVHRPLRLVRTSGRDAPRGLRPDAEGPRGAGGVRRCRGHAVTPPTG